MTITDRFNRTLTDTFDHSHKQIAGYRIAEAAGSFYLNQGYRYQVLEQYWASMGLGTWEYPIVATKSADDAEAFVASMQSAVGKYIAHDPR